MIELVLDGREIRNREELHRCFAETLHFPRWYGANLDALFDCLTELSEEVYIRFLYQNLLEEHLGIYAEKLQRVLLDAAAENPHLRISF